MEGEFTRKSGEKQSAAWGVLSPEEGAPAYTSHTVRTEGACWTSAQLLPRRCLDAQL